jgi:hypothetical protein
MSGRVDVLLNDNFDSYKLFHNNVDNDEFNKEAIKGIHNSNELANLFFSKKNIDVLQQAIRYLTHKRSCGKFVISTQSEHELKLIMRAFYLQEGVHRQYNVVEEVKALNTLVLNYAVPKIIQEIQMYMQYKKDVNQNPVPLERGQFSSSKGTKVLIQKEF